MIVVRIPLRSDPDPASPFAWAEMDVDPVLRTVTIRSCNGRDALKSVKDKIVSIVPDPLAPDELHTLYMDADGTIGFGPRSKTPGEFFAHLGWWEPSTDTLKLIEFRDYREWSEADINAERAVIGER